MISRDPDLDADLELTIGGLRLGPLGEWDAGDLLAHFADPRVVAFMDFEPLSEIDQAHHIIAWARSQRALGAGVRWAIREYDGAFVGTCGFNRIDIDRGRRGEIAYDLGHAWWGRGVMSAILPTIIDFGLRRLALHRLEAMVTPGNARSSRLLERHGFMREGLLRDYGFWKGRYWDQIVFSRLSTGRQDQCEMASGEPEKT